MNRYLQKLGFGVEEEKALFGFDTSQIEAIVVDDNGGWWRKTWKAQWQWRERGRERERERERGCYIKI